MNPHMPTLRQLTYLVALADHGHFGRAAAASFVSQSTLSAGLRELEALLGTTLVERTRRGMRFTRLGEAVVGKARRVLREADELADIVRASAEPLSGEMRMAVIPTIAPFLLPRMLPALHAAWPKLRLFLREEPSGAACDSLHRGAVDCVLLAWPFDCGEVDGTALFDDPLLLAYPAGEAPAGTGPVDPQALDTGRLLLLEDGHCLKDHALAVCGRPDQRAGTPMLGTSLHTLAGMVDGGLGVTLLPQMAVDAGLLNGTRIALRPLDAAAAARTIALVWRRGSPQEGNFRLLAESLRRRGETVDQPSPSPRAGDPVHPG